jgi:hypothetical protein
MSPSSTSPGSAAMTAVSDLGTTPGAVDAVAIAVLRPTRSRSALRPSEISSGPSVSAVANARKAVAAVRDAPRSQDFSRTDASCSCCEMSASNTSTSDSPARP